jgi:hypothetical protein
MVPHRRTPVDLPQSIDTFDSAHAEAGARRRLGGAAPLAQARQLALGRLRGAPQLRVHPRDLGGVDAPHLAAGRRFIQTPRRASHTDNHRMKDTFESTRRRLNGARARGRARRVHGERVQRDKIPRALRGRASADGTVARMNHRHPPPPRNIPIPSRNHH